MNLDIRTDEQDLWRVYREAQVVTAAHREGLRPFIYLTVFEFEQLYRITSIMVAVGQFRHWPNPICPITRAISRKGSTSLRIHIVPYIIISTLKCPSFVRFYLRLIILNITGKQPPFALAKKGDVTSMVKYAFFSSLAKRSCVGKATQQGTTLLSFLSPKDPALPKSPQ